MMGVGVVGCQIYGARCDAVGVFPPMTLMLKKVIPKHLAQSHC